MGVGNSAGCGGCLPFAAFATSDRARGTVDADVIVVGAGLAGLACALRLQEEGVKCIVVEARQIVGGRASRGGADWVHGEHVTTWRYLERFGLKADGAMNGWAEHKVGGPECWVYVDGELRGPDRVHKEPNRLFFAKFDELTERWIKSGRADISLLEVAEQAFDQTPTDDERRLMEGMMAEWHAADLADVGIYEDDLYSERIQTLAKKRPGILSEDGDEGHWRIIGGHQGLAERMAKTLELHLSTVVRGVQWKAGDVGVRCNSGRHYRSHAAVLTVPLACIPDIHFEPSLPEEKRRAVTQLGRGITTTVYLRFRERFWPEKMAFLFHSMSSQCFWPGRSTNVLTAYFGGATANAELLCLSDADMTDEIIRQLSVIFGKPIDELRSLLAGSDVRRWDTDPYAKMAYSYCPVGASSLRHDLGATCGNLFWAGEATHPTKASFAHGALEEGERAAQDVIEFLRARGLWKDGTGSCKGPQIGCEAVL